MRRKWVIGWVLSIALAWLAFRFRSWAYSGSGFPDSPCTVARVFDEGCRYWAKKVGDLLVWGSLLGVLTMTIALARLRPGRGLPVRGYDPRPVDSADAQPVGYAGVVPDVEDEPLGEHAIGGDQFVDAGVVPNVEDEPHGEHAIGGDQFVDARVVPDVEDEARSVSYLLRSFGVAVAVAVIAVAILFILLGLAMQGIWND